MIYMTLLPEWPRGSGIRLFWAGWYAPGCGVPSAAASGPCPFTALAEVMESVVDTLKPVNRSIGKGPACQQKAERGLFT